MEIPDYILFALTFTCVVQPVRCIANDSHTPPSGKSIRGETIRESKQESKPDFNTHIYCKNRLDLSLETGWIPNNIPFIFDFLTGDPYWQPLRNYTLAPIMPSLRWQVGNLAGLSILRGNTEFSVSTSVILIPSGPESRYWDFLLGVRRNFVHRNWRVAPYIEGRLGAGFINAKGPYGVLYAQGQDFTFTLMVDGGARYNFSSRYSLEAGLAYIHISNPYLSEPQVPNFGINVYGPMVGFEMRLGKPH